MYPFDFSGTGLYGEPAPPPVRLPAQRDEQTLADTATGPEDGCQMLLGVLAVAFILSAVGAYAVLC